jgi:hypothetical protein
MAQTELEGSQRTAYVAERIRTFMDFMRRGPSSYHQKLRADINALLDQYQEWCEANYPSEKELAAWKSIKSQGKKEDPG